MKPVELIRVRAEQECYHQAKPCSYGKWVSGDTSENRPCETCSLLFNIIADLKGVEPEVTNSDDKNGYLGE